VAERIVLDQEDSGIERPRITGGGRAQALIVHDEWATTSSDKRQDVHGAGTIVPIVFHAPSAATALVEKKGLKGSGPEAGPPRY
jgi:hypothetical protein